MKPETKERAEKLSRLGARCQAWTLRGEQCSRYGTIWMVDRGRFCEQHAALRGIPIW